MHMVSKRELDSAELETIRISRSPTTVMTANGEVQTREEATEDVKELDFFVTVMFLEETPAVLSLSGNSARIMGILPTGPAVENHNSPRKARNLIAIYQTMNHSFSLDYRRILPRHLHLLLEHHHRRILYLTSTDTPKIPQPKEVEVRVRGYGETRSRGSAETENSNKNKGDEELQK